MVADICDMICSLSPACVSTDIGMVFDLSFVLVALWTFWAIFCYRRTEFFTANFTSDKWL